MIRPPPQPLLPLQQLLYSWRITRPVLASWTTSYLLALFPEHEKGLLAQGRAKQSSVALPPSASFARASHMPATSRRGPSPRQKPVIRQNVRDTASSNPSLVINMLSSHKYDFGAEKDNVFDPRTWNRAQTRRSRVIRGRPYMLALLKAFSCCHYAASELRSKRKWWMTVLLSRRLPQ